MVLIDPAGKPRTRLVSEPSRAMMTALAGVVHLEDGDTPAVVADVTAAERRCKPSRGAAQR